MPSADGVAASGEQGVSAGDLAAIVARLRAAREPLLAMPVRAILTAIDQALTALVEADEATIARLAADAGLHPLMVRAGLRDLARDLSAAQLERLIARELGGPEQLDGFAPRGDGSGWSRAFGPPLTTVVLSGHVYPAAAESILLCLVAKSPCLIKLPAGDQAFTRLLVAALAAADPRIGAALTVVYWPSGRTDLFRGAFAAAGTVIAYGGADAIAAVSALLPAGRRLIAHGPRVSVAVLPEQDAESAGAATAVAQDVAWWDQHGCLSPHTVYVLGGVAAAARFAARLAEGLAAMEREMPRGAVSAGEAAAILQARGAAEFRPGAAVLASTGGTAWTVIVEPEPRFSPSCLNRTVTVTPLTALAALADALAPVASLLQAVGAGGDAAFRLAVAETCAPLSVARVCPLGTMQHPPADWRHDGRPRLLDLLRWFDVEN